MEDVKFLLGTKDIPKSWYNILPDLPRPLDPPLNPATKEPIGPEELAALFPKRDDLGVIQRLALSLGLSIAVMPPIGFVLNYTPWGIGLASVLVSVTLFVFTMGGFAWLRRRKISSQERFGLRFRRPRPVRFWDEQSRLSRGLIGLLVLAVIGAIATPVYLLETPKIGGKSSEFYILGPEGKADNYPSVLALGEKAEAVLVIINHENETVTYYVEVTIDGEKVEAVGPITLADEETWEGKVNFAAAKAGEKQKVEFLLYEGTKDKVDQALHLWIDVTDGS